MLNNLFIVWLASVFLAFSLNGFEGTKVLVFLVGSAFFSLVLGLFESGKKITLSKVDYLYFVFLSVLLISSFVGLNTNISILGGSYRHQGLVFFVGLWFVGKIVQKLKVKEKKLLQKTLWVVLITQIGFGFAQVIFGFGLMLGRPLGFLGEPNALAGFVTILYIWLISNIKKPNFKFFITSIMVTILILLTGSKLCLGILILYFLVNIYRKCKLTAIIIASFLLMLGGIWIVFKTPKITPVSFSEDRWEIWQVSLVEIIKEPILGYGLESGEIVFDEAYQKLESPLEGMIIDRTHNLFLDILMWSGVIGLTSFIFFLWSGIEQLWIKRNSKSLLALGAFLLFSFFQPLGVSHWLLLFLIFYF